MKKTLSLLFAMLLGAQAFASDSKAPEDALSTIEVDGRRELVEVGDKNKFTYQYRPWNIGLSPLVAMDYTVISIERAVVDHVSIRLGIGYSWGDTMDIVEHDFRLSAPIYFRKMHDGFFFEPNIGIEKWDTGDSGLDENNVYLGSTLGWKGIWDSGFTVTMGFGMGKYINVDDEDGDFMTPTGRFEVGYSF